MNKTSPFASLTSLRVFIVIFTGFALVLIAASAFVALTAFNAFDTAWSRMDTLEKLQNGIVYDQNDVFINEAYYVYAQDYGTDPNQLTEYQSNRQASDDSVTSALNDLVKSGVFDASIYDPKSQPLVDQLIQQRQQESGTFTQLVAAYEAGEEEQINSLYTTSRDQSDAILSTIDQLVVRLEHERTSAVAEFPGDLSLTIGGILVGIAISMLLALWGYRKISGLTAPLLSLHAGVSAIRADTFRPEIVAEARRSPGQIGALARTLESLNQTMSQRDARQKEELAALKQELIQSRRRRLHLVGKPVEDQDVKGGAQ